MPTARLTYVREYFAGIRVSVTVPHRAVPQLTTLALPAVHERLPSACRWPNLLGHEHQQGKADGVHACRAAFFATNDLASRMLAEF